MENNNAPFYVGQEVVRIKNGQRGEKIGDEHVVYENNLCPKCKKWFIDIGIREPVRAPRFLSVCSCGNKSEMHAPIVWVNASSFAPKENLYTDISKELADSFKHTDEVPDKVLVPEKVNSIENQLLQGNEEMLEVFNSLPPEQQQEFKVRVEETLNNIKRLISK